MRVGGLLLPLLLLLLLLLGAREERLQLVGVEAAGHAEGDAELLVLVLHLTAGLLARGLLQLRLGGGPRELPGDALGDATDGVRGHLLEVGHLHHLVDDGGDRLLALLELDGLLELLGGRLLLLLLLAGEALLLRLRHGAEGGEALVGVDEAVDLVERRLVAVLVVGVPHLPLGHPVHHLEDGGHHVDEALDGLGLVLERDGELLVLGLAGLLRVLVEADLHAEEESPEREGVHLGLEDDLRNLRLVLLEDLLPLRVRTGARGEQGGELLLVDEHGLLLRSADGVEDGVQLLAEGLRLVGDDLLLLGRLALRLLGLALLHDLREHLAHAGLVEHLERDLVAHELLRDLEERVGVLGGRGGGNELQIRVGIGHSNSPC